MALGVVLGLDLVAALGVLGATAWAERAGAQAASLAAEIEALREVERQYQNLGRTHQELRQRLSVLADLAGPGPARLEAARRALAAAPGVVQASGVFLGEEGALRLAGQAPSHAAVSRYALDLVRNRGFVQVELVVSAHTPGAGLPVNFEISAWPEQGKARKP